MTAVAKRWTPSELNLLQSRCEASVHPKLIAAELGRSIQSVINRVQRVNKRRCDARYRRALQEVPRIVEEHAEFPPPPYVLRERKIRLSIPPTSVTQVMFCDPVEGYSALANKVRRISVQDALEICALYTGRMGEKTALAAIYKIAPCTITSILSGEFFDRLIPRRA